MLLIHADARAIPLPDNYVQCVVTSPPYWGLRDYGVEGQIGLEKTPDAYVASLVEVFREVRRVLRDDGTVWLNLGDSYNNFRVEMGPGQAVHGRDKLNGKPAVKSRRRGAEGLKEKDLVGIPWMVAFALRADGWYLRSDIIWAKPNPMPESVTDRPTRSHEYLFLLTKRERYYYDFEGAKEAAAGVVAGNRTRKEAAGRDRPVGSGNVASGVPWAGSAFRNRRSVWTITTKPYRGAHFATFPPELVEPCVLAGTPEGGCCGTCGTPLKRIVERGQPNLAHQQACGADAAGQYDGTATKDYATAGAQDPSATKARILAGMVERRTLGWQQTCDCVEGTPVQSVVLDPFCGAGTVGVVAQQLNRCFVGIDRKWEYLHLAQCRITGHGC